LVASENTSKSSAVAVSIVAFDRITVTNRSPVGRTAAKPNAEATACAVT
jgi:hypothetical protein